MGGAPKPLPRVRARQSPAPRSCSSALWSWPPAPYYPSSGWRGGALLIVIAGVLGATILALVERVGASERLHRLLAENSSDLVIRGSRDGCIRYASPALVALLGYAPEELVGIRIAELTHPEDAAGRDERLARIDASPRIAMRLARMRHRDGRWLWLEATVRPIRNGAGDVVERQSAYRDVTERVQREEEQRALSRLATLIASGGDPTQCSTPSPNRSLGCSTRSSARSCASTTPAPRDVVGAWTMPGCEPPGRRSI